MKKHEKNMKKHEKTWKNRIFQGGRILAKPFIFLRKTTTRGASGSEKPFKNMKKHEKNHAKIKKNQ